MKKWLGYLVKADPSANTEVGAVILIGFTTGWVEMARLLIYPVLVAWVVPRLVVPHVLRAPMAQVVLQVRLAVRLLVLVRLDLLV
jgi:hypothetical protein